MEEFEACATARSLELFLEEDFSWKRPTPTTRSEPSVTLHKEDEYSVRLGDGLVAVDKTCRGYTFEIGGDEDVDGQMTKVTKRTYVPFDRIARIVMRMEETTAVPAGKS